MRDVPMIHTFRSTEDAYNKSQCGYIKYPHTLGTEPTWEDLDNGVETVVEDGDVLHIPSERVVAIMYYVAWPTAITPNRGELEGFTVKGQEGERTFGKYNKSFAIADKLIKEHGYS